MEHIQKYKIEDESLDDQMDNYIYSQNSYSNNIPTKNVNIIQNNSKPKTINISQKSKYQNSAEIQKSRIKIK